jgi:hypothetical protein
LTDDDSQSGTVDFEEFLELVHRVVSGLSDGNSGFGKAYTRTARRTALRNRLSLELQVRYQLL